MARKVEPVVLERGRGREELYKVTGPHGHHIGYFTLEQLAEILDVASLREVDD